MLYYILKNTQRTGPCRLDELRQMEISWDTLVWYEGLDGWTKANEILELLDIVNGSRGSKGVKAELGSELQLDVPGNYFSGALRFTDRHNILREIVLPMLLIAILCLVVVIAYVRF